MLGQSAQGGWYLHSSPTHIFLRIIDLANATETTGRSWYDRVDVPSDFLHHLSSQKTAAQVLRFDPRALVDENGYLKKLKELDDAPALALHSVDFDGDVISKVRVDQTAARQQLMKHLGLFKEDNEQKPNVEVHAPGARIEFTPIPKTRKG